MNIEKQHQSLPIPLDERLMENIIGTGLKPKFSEVTSQIQ